MVQQTGQPLSDLQRLIVEQAWQGQKYRTIAHRYGCTEGHVKDVAADLWQLLSTLLATPVSKQNLRSVLDRGLEIIEIPDPQPFSLASVSPPLLLGRQGSIEALQHLIQAGNRVIVIQGEGGIGKTTLAQHYLQSQGFEVVLELLMAKETQNITPVERVVEEWFCQDLQEEPGREFGVTLGRLKRQLQQRSIGILIDNLEPALDPQGRFVALHRGYGELLRVLADTRLPGSKIPQRPSVTLITSRDRLCEPGVNVVHYRLPGLSEETWQIFFNTTFNTTPETTTIVSDGLRPASGHSPPETLRERSLTIVQALHRAYGGNAKAMGLLRGTIGEDFDGDMEAYWQEYQDHPLSLMDLKNLIVSQVERLQQLDPDAYRLFCRLGCYRYQDIPTVSKAGLIALMWDIAPDRQHEIGLSLQNRSLIESHKGQYSLHPALRAEAIARLRQSSDWELANRRAAKFWTDQVVTITTLSAGIQALEAYYHYEAIGDIEAAGEVLLKSRDNQWGQSLPLASTLYRMGLIQPILTAITQILDREASPFVQRTGCANAERLQRREENRLQSPRPLSELHNILGDLYWITGRIHAAIHCQETAMTIARNCLNELDQADTETAHQRHSHYFFRMLEVDSRLSIGLYHMDLWELPEAIQWLQQVIILAQDTAHHSWAEKATVCLALVEAYLGHRDQALILADRAYATFLQTPSPKSTGRAAYFIQRLGQAYGVLSHAEEEALTHHDRALHLYQQAIAFAEASHYLQVKANALKGMAELDRQQGQFEQAIARHQESIELLEAIGATCDLADALFQLGITCSLWQAAQRQTPPHLPSPQELCDRAIHLFEAIQAPKQVDRVQQYLQGLPYSQ